MGLRPRRSGKELGFARLLLESVDEGLGAFGEQTGNVVYHTWSGTSGSGGRRSPGGWRSSTRA